MIFVHAQFRGTEPFITYGIITQFRQFGGFTNDSNPLNIVLCVCVKLSCVCVCLLGSDWGSSSCVYQRSSHLGRQKLCVCCSITGESLNCQYAYIGSPNLPVRPTGYIDVQLAHVYQMDLFM